MLEALQLEFTRNALMAGLPPSLIRRVTGTLVVVNRIFYHRAGTMIQLFCILLLMPLFFTACTTLPRASQDISEKNSNFESLLLDFYKGPLNHLNGVRRGECPMYPSCSRYCDESLRKHGFLIGWMMTCDRLMRCGRNEIALAPKININGKIKCHDPVIENDWWWYDARDRFTGGRAEIKKGPLTGREGTP